MELLFIKKLPGNDSFLGKGKGKRQDEIYPVFFWLSVVIYSRMDKELFQNNPGICFQTVSIHLFGEKRL